MVDLNVIWCMFLRKIMLISSYGSDSESEEEEDAIQSETNTENSKV